ncbi:MAG: YjgP/YjgQ family permease [bacterium]|nr:YjgP/YjgQ family permease [bacterium]
MTTLDRYLFKRLVAALFKGMAALVFMYVLIDLLTHREVAIAKYEVPWSIVARYYLVFAPKMIYQVAPLALLVSALLVLGDMAQHNEVTAALAGGISLRRLTRAPVITALIFAVGLFAFEEKIGAAATREAARIEQNYFSRNAYYDRDGVSWANLTGKWTCHIRKFNRIALTGEGVLAHSIREDMVEYIEADRIYWDEAANEWLLEDGTWSEFDAAISGRRIRRVTQRPAPFLEPPELLFALDEPTDAKTTRQLATDIQYALEHAMPAGKLHTDYHAKYSWPALCFVMIGLAIPFALRLRRGGLAISFGASIAIAMTYLVLFYASMSLGHAGRISPITAAWFANVVFFVTGLILFYRTPT